VRLRRGGSPGAPLDLSSLQTPKLRAIDFAVERVSARSVADLGGVWAVEGGYARYALTRPGVERAVLVDTGLTDVVRGFARADPRLRLVDGEFGRQRSIDAVGVVDVVLLLDVLLHQVDPDWDEVLRRYAKTSRCIVIVEPTYTGDEVVRFWDLGEEGYRANTPADGAIPDWSLLDEPHPTYTRTHRDVHEYWQWGLPDRARRDLMESLGWTCAYWADHGPWRDVPTSRTIATVYVAPSV
jgi:hypothetical protein